MPGPYGGARVPVEEAYFDLRWFDVDRAGQQGRRAEAPVSFGYVTVLEVSSVTTRVVRHRSDAPCPGGSKAYIVRRGRPSRNHSLSHSLRGEEVQMNRKGFTLIELL